MKTNYEDILYLLRPVSKRHQPMSLLNRAAQFAPFAALTGYEDAVAESARRTSPRLFLSEDQMNDLNQQLSRITQKIAQRPHVSVTYFQPDNKKHGGTYLTFEGSVKKVDEINRQLVMDCGFCVPIHQIISISCESSV